MKKIKNMTIEKILKEYEPKHEGILKDKVVEREKKIKGRWNIGLCKKYYVFEM